MQVKPLNIGLLGAGRMGRQIMREMARDPGCALSGVWVRAGSELAGAELSAIGGEAAAGVTAGSDLAAVLEGADVAIDFTLPAASRSISEAAAAAGVPLVTGVSGLERADLEGLEAAAGRIPVFYDRNMSVGVAVMRRLVGQAATLLGEDFPAEIHDTHHAAKRDAPSGTALLLGESLAAGRGRELGEVMRYDPEGAAERRDRRDIVFRVTREGEHPGRHDVRFTGPAESLAITHEVSDRAVFALGALRAARWLVDRPPGLYGMQQLLDDLLDGG